MLEIILLATLVINVDLSVPEPLELDNNEIDIKETDDFKSEEIWGPLLEDYATANNNNRESRVLKIVSNTGEIIVDSLKTDEMNHKHSTNVQKESKISSGNKIVNNAAYSYPNTVNNVNNVKPKPQGHQVSETDLYLLGAIEKLVYRVDFMEKRLRRLEQMLFYTMAGNRIDQEVCNHNFTRVVNGCYLFASKAGREGDWKMASKYCHKLGTHLVEFETPEEYQDVISFIQIRPELKGKDFWTGGLNPGLLWIWSNSGRPISTSKKSKRVHQLNANSSMQATETKNQHTSRLAHLPIAIKTQPVERRQNNISATIRMAGANIDGKGPCLKLEYDQNLRTYVYKGTDCSVRYNYICEQGDNTSSSQIREFGTSRKILAEEI